MDSSIHRGRVPPHRARHRAARAAAGGGPLPVAQAPRRATHRHRGYGLHDLLLWINTLC